MQLFIMLCWIIIASGCDIKGNDEVFTEAQTLTVASWNVQALFDDEENGIEYDEYSQEAGWNKEKYQARLKSISGAINQMASGGPDIVALMEIENDQVIDDLVGGYLAKNGYKWTFFGTNPGYSLGLGVISKLPFTQTKLHSSNTKGEVIPRPIIEVRINKDDHVMVLFVCHWKSKLNGETEYLRKAAAKIVLRRIQQIKAEDPSIPVIVAGDLNENYDEFYRNKGELITALMPDDPDAAAKITLNYKTTPDFLVISKQKPPVNLSFDSSLPALYCPWGNELVDGSYSYKNQWETIDHILLSQAFFDEKSLEFDTCFVINKAPFINQKGLPFMYNTLTGDGLSDHLPLLLKLSIKNGQE